MKPEVSLPCLQVPATCPYSEQDESNPYFCPPSQFYFRKMHFNIVRSSGSLFPSDFPTKTMYAPHLCSPPYVPHAPPISLFLIWFPNNIWRGVQIMKLLVVKFTLFPFDIGEFYQNLLVHFEFWSQARVTGTWRDIHAFLRTSWVSETTMFLENWNMYFILRHSPTHISEGPVLVGIRYRYSTYKGFQLKSKLKHTGNLIGSSLIVPLLLSSPRSILLPPSSHCAFIPETRNSARSSKVLFFFNFEFLSRVS